MTTVMESFGELTLPEFSSFEPADRTPAISKELPGASQEKAAPAAVIFDEDYLARLRRGDDETARHFNRYFRELLRLKLWQKFDGQRVRDLIDEVMVAAIEKILKGQPRDASRLVAYICGICSNMTKKEIRLRPANTFVDLNLNLFADVAPRPDHRLLAREKAETVRKVLLSLSSRDRAVLVDLFWEELTREEVCVKYAVSREHLRLILHHARRRFQKRWVGQ